MRHLATPIRIALGALALVAVGAATSAHAGTDVFVSLGVQPAGVYVQPQPVYVQPRPVYVQPQPGYVYTQPVYQTQYAVGSNRRGPYGDYDGDGIVNRYDPHPYHYDRTRRAGGWHDQDRDGIRDRYDRDRDGDGVPNRYDRRPDNGRRY